jgi:hypothetical protein
MDSDRLFASWELHSPRVEHLLSEARNDPGAAERTIEIPADFSALLKSDPQAAQGEVLRVREEFVQALGDGYVCGPSIAIPKGRVFVLFRVAAERR